MNPFRQAALATMRLTRQAARVDFLALAKVNAPVPYVPGALPDHARVIFPAFLTGRLAIDLVVCWTIGDFGPGRPCSEYYDPDSPWYNVFYGAYGILSHKPDGSHYGYDTQGTASFPEMLAVPELDYNVLTAGQLGCPPAKRIFTVRSLTTSREGRWDRGDVVAQVPSGLHHPRDALDANPLWYSIFGFPDPRLAAGHASYEPVEMRGTMYFRPVSEVASLRLTLVWGAMCPDTAPGNALLAQILAALRPRYP